MNINKVIVAGRMTGDPELRSTNSGNPLTSFSVATNRYWSNDQGKQEEVEFHNVVVWGKRAETVSQFLSKGSLVLIEGRLRTRSWEDKGGVKKYTTEIIAENVQFGPKRDDSQKAPDRNPPKEKQNGPWKDNLDKVTEDIPFD